MGRPCISQRRELLTCNTYTVLCLTQTFHSKGINTSTVLPLNMGVGFNWHARRPLSMSIDNEENYWGGSRLTCIAIISSSLGLGSRAYTSFGNPITHWPHTPFPPQWSFHEQLQPLLHWILVFSFRVSRSVLLGSASTSMYCTSPSSRMVFAVIETTWWSCIS